MEPVVRGYEAGGFRIAARVVERPDAPAIVCVHGLPASTRYFVPLLRELGAWASAYAPDLPGFGSSEHPPRALDVPELAGALGDWLDTAGLDRPTLVANSFGCQVALHLLADSPGSARGVVLVGPTVDAGARTRRQQILRLVESARYERPSLIPIVVADALRAGLLRTWRTLGYALRDRPEDVVRRVAVPALVVRGELDPLASQAFAQLLAQRLPSGELHVVAGGGHALNHSRPRELSALVRAFVGR